MFLLNLPANAAENETAPQGSQQRIMMKITGKALDHKAAADYITILQRAGLFIDVKLVHTRRDPADPAGMADFEIECLLMPALSFMGVNYADMQQTQNF